MDKVVYVLGEGRDEEALVDLNVHYFDGTPAIGLRMIEEWSGRGLTGTRKALIADKDGKMQDHVALNADAFDDTGTRSPSTSAMKARTSRMKSCISTVISGSSPAMSC